MNQRCLVVLASLGFLSCDQPTGTGSEFAGSYSLKMQFTENTCDPDPTFPSAIFVLHERGHAEITMRQDPYGHLVGTVGSDGMFQVSGQGGSFRHSWWIEGQFGRRSFTANVRGSYFQSGVVSCSYKMTWTGARR